ncbi:hypothetical protein CPC08DRAFT_301737 [Agrocybe pediades]|nr:hypothetical protein CPC08DRAFT_301737 [Agrocybe pediades]
MPYVGPGSTTTTTTASPIAPPPSFGLVRSLSLPNPHSPEPSTSTSPSSSPSSPPTSRESSNTAEEDVSHPTSPGMLSPLGLTALSPPMSFRQFAGFAQQEKQDQPQTSSPQETQHQQGQHHPQQPAGRPGHRRSYSHTHITAPSSYKPSSPDSYTGPSFNFSLSSNSSRNGLGSLPTRRSRTGSGAHSRSGSDVGPSVSQGGGAQQHKFHIGGSYRNREGGQSLSSEEDDSSDEKSPPPPSLPPTPSRMKGRAKEDDDSEVDREERDRMLRLPPLKLRVRTGSAWDEPPLQRRVGTPPLSVPAQAATANAVPFPTTKSPSPVGSATVLPLPVLEVVPSKANEADASSSNTNNNGLRPPLAAPQMRRATSESSGLPTSASLAVAATSAASGPPVIVLTEAPQPQPSSSAQTQAQAQVASPPPSTPTYAQTYPNRPTPSRTASSPILLLSNGKPLRSSLKSSSSSPNIPFPSQSLVPSMLWPDLHRDRHARYSTTGYEGDSTTTNSGAGQGHQRTASAPSTPNIGGSSVPPPSLTSSVSSIASSLGPGPGDSTTSTPTSSAHTTPASSPPLSPHMQYHPHPPKNVHFPSQDNNLATVKIFNKGARPAAVSLSRTGSNGGAGVDGQRAGDAEERGTGTEGESQTETETEGEAGTYGGGYGGYGGFGAGLLGRWGRNAWGAVGGSSSSGVFGYGTYVGGGSRSVPAVSSSGDSNGTGASGYPFPKVHPQQHSGKPSQVGRMQAQVQGADSESEVDSGREGGGKEKEKEKEKGEWYFDLDAAGSSCVPMIGAERGEGNGNVYLESVGFVRGVKDFGELFGNCVDWFIFVGFSCFLDFFRAFFSSLSLFVSLFSLCFQVVLFILWSFLCFCVSSLSFFCFFLVLSALKVSYV